MTKFVTLRVTPIAKTQFFAPHDVPWEPDVLASDGENLAEFAGRACYQSWDKPNPATATNEGYLQHILNVGHLSVLEHGIVSFYIEGISRSLTHELVRHRHFSYSQLSQRYVDSSDTKFVMPSDPLLADIVKSIITVSAESQIVDYEEIVHAMYEALGDAEGITKTERRKRARQTARAVLGNFTETKIVMTGNYRAWRHFISLRCTPGADTEIRACAFEILKKLMNIAPNVFNDFKIYELSDGTFAAKTEVGKEQ